MMQYRYVAHFHFECIEMGLQQPVPFLLPSLARKPDTVENSLFEVTQIYATLPMCKLPYCKCQETCLFLLGVWKFHAVTYEKQSMQRMR